MIPVFFVERILRLENKKKGVRENGKNTSLTSKDSKETNY